MRLGAMLSADEVAALVDGKVPADLLPPAAGGGLDPALTAALTAATPAPTALNPYVTSQDARLTDARAPTAHAHAQADVTNLVADLAGKAASAHSHSGADITSGTVAAARLGTGTPGAANFLRGDGAWAAAGASDWTTRVTKSAHQDMTNNATAQNDSELKIAVLTGEVWFVQLLLVYAGSDATGDYKLDFGLPTATGWWRYLGDSTTADAILVSTGIRLAAATALAAQVSLGVTASVTTPRVFKAELFFRAGANGDLQFKFGNAAAAAGRISRTCAGSVLQGRKLA